MGSDSIRRASSLTDPVKWAVLGAVVLVTVVVLAAFSQAAIYECAPCSGDLCGPDGQTCPDTPLFLSTIVLALGVASASITIGPSEMSARRSSAREQIGGRRSTSSSRGYPKTASFAIFLGWGLAAYGLLQLWGRFAQCIEPCSPGFDLQGIPLAMTAAGFVIIATGGALFVIPRRVNRMIGRSP